MVHRFTARSTADETRTDGFAWFGVCRHRGLRRERECSGVILQQNQGLTRGLVRELLVLGRRDMAPIVVAPRLALDRIEQDVRWIRTLKRNGLVGPPIGPPTRKAVWMIIWIILGFLAVVTLLVLFHSQKHRYV